MESGKLGQITYARVHNYHNGSVAPQADGSLGWLPPHFYDEVQTGGGAMMDLGAHPMYTLHWFLGEPKSVVSQFTQVTHRGVEDNAVSVLEFEGGAIGVSETGFVTSGNGYFLELSGTQGSLHVFGDHGDRLEYSCPETGGINRGDDRPAPAGHHAHRRLDCRLLRPGPGPQRHRRGGGPHPVYGGRL